MQDWAGHQKTIVVFFPGRIFNAKEEKVTQKDNALYWTDNSTNDQWQAVKLIFLFFIF